MVTMETMWFSSWIGGTSLIVKYILLNSKHTAQQSSGHVLSSEGALYFIAQVRAHKSSMDIQYT